MFKDGKRYGLEFKRSGAPTLTSSMKIAMEDLKLDRLDVLYPGAKPYPLTDKINAIPLKDWLKLYSAS